MSFLAQVIGDAVKAALTFDPAFRSILGLTLVVSGLATIIGVAVGVPLGAGLALFWVPFRRAVRLLVDVGMGMPPVLAGLFLLLLVWRTGPLGSLNLAFTPTAMIIAQVLLAVPIAAGVTGAAIEGLPQAAREQLDALSLPAGTRMRVAIFEAWPGVASSAAAAFGRVVGEVGAVLVVGGNIAGETRVLTTFIVQESRQGLFGPAVGAGIWLFVIALVVNGGLSWLRER